VLALLMCGLMAAYALWYTSSGNFPAIPRIQNDYIDLGKAFLGGQLSLQEQPDPRLATLPNPYEFKQRKHIPYHWDASYFQGKYYLYWGPVPGLIAAGLQSLSGTPLAASVLVVLPYIGLMPIVLALLVELSRYFPNAASQWSLGIFILVGFANLPLLYLIGQPRHYQASIIYGQLFLLLGLLGVAHYARAGKPAWLALSGLSWGLALACRYNLAISVAIYLLFTLSWLWRRRGQDRLGAALSALIIPLVMSMAGLGLYNYARFGNPLETGLTYQLTIPEFREISYSASYIASNLYVYLLYPLTGSGAFPFIQSAHFRLSMLPARLTIPAGREFDQAIFGLLRTAPAVWLCGLTLPIALLAGRGTRREGTSSNSTPRNLLFSMSAFAAGGQFAFLLVFFYAAERYVADFYLPLVLCLAMIIWYVDQRVAGRSVLRIALWSAVVGLTLWTAAIGYFGCFGVPTLVGNYYDPAMLERLASFWNGCYASLRAIWRAAPG